MKENEKFSIIKAILGDAGIAALEIQEREFPGEIWFVVLVSTGSLITAQSLAGTIENELNATPKPDGTSFVVTFRAKASEPKLDENEGTGGRLSNKEIDQLIQLLEARSRTSDALPSLKYVKDPRSSLSAVGASRHQFIYGRRGVGKTALLLEAKRLASEKGDTTVWMNAHTFRGLSPEVAFLSIAENVLAALGQSSGSSTAESYVRLRKESEQVTKLRAMAEITKQSVSALLPALNTALRSVLREELHRLNIYIDDFYLFPLSGQPYLLDFVFGMLRDCDGWIKIASIERLTRPFEPSSKAGLEIPHDASKVDLDITLEDPAAAQGFLESVLSNYTTTAGILKPRSIAKNEALGRLVLASGGVPRDYLNLFASSIVVARQARAKAAEIGREDVAVAAGKAARSKKIDLEQDVSSNTARLLLDFLERISREVKGAGFTYFKVDFSQKNYRNYELLAQLADLRFVHLVQAGFSDQHKPGVKYEAYILDLSEYTDVRLKRNLNVLDLDNGKWSARHSGKAKTSAELTATQLRDRLRRSPLIDLTGVLES